MALNPGQLAVRTGRRSVRANDSRIPGAFLLACLTAGGCGQTERERPPTPAPPPTIVSLAVAGDLAVDEADNRGVPLLVRLDSAAGTDITAQLEFTGTATRGRDYIVDSDALVVSAGAVSAETVIDIFRDFDAEEDETIVVGLRSVSGPARPASESSVTLTVLDGGAADFDKLAYMPGSELNLLPTRYDVTEESIELAFLPFNTSPDTATLSVDLSTEFEFGQNVQSIGAVEVPPVDPEIFNFPMPQNFSLPLAGLEPNGRYFIRVLLAGPGAEPPVGGGPPPAGVGLLMSGFQTGPDGRVVVRCETPERDVGTPGTDPLFAEQWHLQNTGQTAFSNAPGVAGADLRMDGAISAGRGGAGVKLAVVDSGLEICHPDLAANVAPGQSYNFGFGSTAGASPTDPFNHRIVGDHGTLVAGVAAAVAGNGRGGRGVAPEVSLVGFNVGAASFAGDGESASYLSLGASSADPDSASVDIFNMSFGGETTGLNASEDDALLFRMGTTELRSGRGALYIKAAGNSFQSCLRFHPLNEETGCLDANADPDHGLPYLIPVGAFNAEDVKSSFSSAGASLWVVGPAGEDGLMHPAIITTDQIGAGIGADASPRNALSTDHPQNRDGDYTNAFSGTSAATPAVAGAVAVLLGAYPELTWRDVKHILAASARQIDPDRGEVRAAFNGRPYIAQHGWQTNGAGFRFHNWYGFGAVDVDAALDAAAAHTPDSLGEFVESPWFDAEEPAAPGLAVPDADGGGVNGSLVVAGLPDTSNIEAAVLEISVDHENALDLGITLTSPADTASVVNPPFNTGLDGHGHGLREWRLLSNAFYGENPNGTWTLNVADLAEGDTGELISWRLRLYYGEHP